MFDLLPALLHAASAGKPCAYILSVCAGFATSFGPCTATRIAAAASLTTGAPRSNALRVAALCAGVLASYLVLGSASAAVSFAFRNSAIFYALLAGAMLAAGVRSLLFCNMCRNHAISRNGSLGGLFLTGAWFPLVISPCCTPAIAAIGALGAAAGKPAYSAALLAAYGCGHLIPIVAAAVLSGRVRRIAAGDRLRLAFNSTTAAVLVALGIYYLVLA